MTTEHRSISRRSLLKFGGGGAAAIAIFGLTACSEDEAPNPFDGNGADVKESPMLTERVDAGELPELAERLPASPMEVEVMDGPAQYGGTLNRAQTEVGDAGALTAFASVGLLEWNWESDGYLPSLAEEFTKNETNTEFTFVLREGLKWSDGEPFTSADLQFTIDDVLRNETTIPAAPFWFSDGDARPTVEVPDERTVIIRYTQPFALFEKYMCHPAVSNQFLKPRHYLEQFHPTYTDQAEVDAATAAAGFDSWDQYFGDRDNWWTNPERPVLGAYQVLSAANAQSGTATLERNPYFWKVDPDGRQLPFIDEIQVQVLAQDALDLRAANGDLNFQGNFLGYNSAQVYLQNAEDRGYEMLRWQNDATLLSLCVNLSHADEVLRDLFLQVDFRAALSHAIDREDLNATLLGGLGDVRQPLATENSDYYVEGTGQRFIEFDVDRANELLDGIGLTRGADGVRLRPDGQPLALVLLYVDSTAGVPTADAFTMVQRYWAEIGITLSLRPVDPTLYAELRSANDFDVDGTTMPSDDFDLEPVWYIPTGANSHSAPAFGQWYASNGAEGIEPPEEIRALMDNWDLLRGAATDEERVEAGRAIVTQHDENVYAIGLLGLPFQPVIVTNDVRGVRDDEPKLSFYYGREGITKPEQISFLPA
jgi:peptide/nickel transport system substrate-binding protein